MTMTTATPNQRDKNKGRRELCERLQSRGYRTGAEIGVQFGAHAEMLLSRVSCTLTLVDPWAASQRLRGRWYSADAVLAVCEARLDAFRGRTKLVRETSETAAQRFTCGAFDFVYLDGLHTAAGVAADLEAWYPLVRQGGMICGHDYVNHDAHCWVREPVDAFFGAVGRDVHSTPGSTWPEWWVFCD